MKTNFLIVCIAFVLSLILNIGLGKEVDRAHTKITNLETEKDSINQAIAKYDFDDCNNGIHFCWNDDEESIPTPGSLVKVEFIDQDIIYIGPIELQDVIDQPEPKPIGKGILVSN